MGILCIKNINLVFHKIILKFNSHNKTHFKKRTPFLKKGLPPSHFHVIILNLFLGSGHISTVTFEGKVVKSLDACSTKKLAEQSAAKAGLIELGIKDPDEVALRLLRRYSIIITEL